MNINYKNKYSNYKNKYLNYKNKHLQDNLTTDSNNIICTTETNGRLGNQIIRNLAFNFIAKKHDLKVNYSNQDLINKLGIDLYSGNKIYKFTQELNDDNYFDILNSDNLMFNLDPNKSYFQTNKIMNYLYKYLNNDIKSNIIENNPFKERYNNNNDLFIHVRLTDATKWNPGITYYLKTIKIINFDNLYISTDDKDHSFIKKIFELYPSAELIDYNEIKTFQFGSTCKHIILSHGSFSAIIGYLSFFSNIYYPEFESNKIWHGDMFSIDNWIKMKVK